jgi:hypothetical protein
MVGVVVTSHAAKHSHVSVREGAPEGEGLSDVHLVERLLQPLFDLRRRFRH